MASGGAAEEAGSGDSRGRRERCARAGELADGVRGFRIVRDPNVIGRGNGKLEWIADSATREASSPGEYLARVGELIDLVVNSVRDPDIVVGVNRQRRAGMNPLNVPFGYVVTPPDQKARSRSSIAPKDCPAVVVTAVSDPNVPESIDRDGALAAEPPDG